MAREIPTRSIIGYLGPGTELTGGLHFDRTFRVDGRVRGGHLTGKTLIVGVDADVEGRIEVDVLSVLGRVGGEIHVRNKLEILPGGKVDGSIRLDGPGLVLEEGGCLEGTVDIGEGPGEGGQRHEKRRRDTETLP